MSRSAFPQGDRPTLRFFLVQMRSRARLPAEIAFERSGPENPKSYAGLSFSWIVRNRIFAVSAYWKMLGVRNNRDVAAFFDKSHGIHRQIRPQNRIQCRDRRVVRRNRRPDSSNGRAEFRQRYPRLPARGRNVRRNTSSPIGATDAGCHCKDTPSSRNAADSVRDKGSL